MQAPPKLFFLGIIFIVVACSNVKTQENSALLGIKTVSDDITKGAFTNAVNNVVKKVAPFIRIFPSVIKLIFGLSSRPTESPELKFLRNLSDTINRRFDQIDVHFLDVTRLIRWSTTQTVYSDLEAKIHVVSEHFTRLFQVPESGYNEQKNIFIQSYETDYFDSGSKLFAAFMFDNGAISEGLIRPAMNYTDNDRAKMRTFMLGILKLLIVSAKLEIGYLTLKGYDNIILFYIHEWNNRIKRVQNKMQTVDLELENIYYTQSLKDIDTFTFDNFYLDYEKFSQRLYDKLSSKYFWRDWLVIVHTHMRGVYSHSHVCKGIMKTAHGKDIVIDSVQKGEPYLNVTVAQLLYKSLQKTCQNTANFFPCAPEHPCSYPYGNCMGRRSCNDYLVGSRPCRRIRRCGSYKNSENADTIYSWFSENAKSCSTFSSVGIMPIGQRAYHSGPTGNSSSRFFLGDLSPCDYKVHFFG
ncbi:uncharacterized protein LOC133195168 [Saccostrea echinata]|uniref:uncharacterized protein LOC133195168 n=1 Tax=Saccostrea echinata TaxID=191078 RepID=UPI002A7F5D48|nr:uncharacterized protein LOC133195168 [Saccostrea echinata]